MYEEARAEFDQFATMDAPNLPDNPISALQVRLYRWQIANFGLQPNHTMVLGIIEEVGELAAAKTPGELIDAFGDICVYMSQLCTALRLGFVTILEAVDGRQLSTSYAEIDSVLLKQVGRLSHTTLKREQAIRGFHDDVFYKTQVVELLTSIVDLAARRACVPNQCEVFEEVAEIVMKRKWKKHPVDADKKV